MDYETRLEKNRSGKWEIRWTEPDRAAPGKYRSRSVSTRTDNRADAEKVRREFLRHDEAIGQRRAGGITVNALLDLYIASLRKRNAPSGERPGAFAQLRRSFGHMEAEGLETADLDGYGDNRVNADGSARRRVKDGSLRRELAAFRAALNWGLRTGKIKGTVPLFVMPPSGRARERFMDGEQAATLFAAAARDEGGDGDIHDPVDAKGRLSRMGRFACIGLETGARASAITGLTWDRVDLRRGKIDFRDPFLPVSKKRRVSTPITARLRPVLERAWQEREHGAVFVLGTNGRISDKRFRTFTRRLGLGWVTPHVLRHTRITLLLQAGVSIWDVSGLVGASPSVIETVYGHHVTDERMLELANRRVTA